MEELANIDALVESTEASTNQEIPMEAPEVNQAPEVPQTPQEYEFESEGRKYKGDIEKLKRWAQQGVTAPNRIGELSKKLSDYEGRFKQYEPYTQIDEWAKQNPDKWQNLVENWKQAQFGAIPQQGQEQAQRLPPEVIQKLQEHDQRWSQFDQQQTIQKQKAADTGLDQEINSIRNQYSNFDFDAPDESGKPLELRILEYATKNGIPDFEAAFLKYCKPQLAQAFESKGREKASMSPKTKAGLLGKDQAPGRGQKTPDLKSRNYDQIHELILEELGLSG